MAAQIKETVVNGLKKAAPYAGAFVTGGVASVAGKIAEPYLQKAGDYITLKAWNAVNNIKLNK